ncbi:MAG TPA: hypothetical protein VH914_17170 [Acidimicrobiia bacterium]|nr:hypothetical protein [Acidimicrobiia bacterium]
MPTTRDHRPARPSSRGTASGEPAHFSVTIPNALSGLRRARRQLATELAARGFEDGHAQDVVSVVNELATAAIECDVTRPLQLTVLPYPRMTTVRLRCERSVELRDRPFQIRQRMLRRLTLETGRRTRDDGDVDLWAEVVRRP